MNIVATIGDALNIFKKDKWIIIFSLVPVIIGALLYFWFGSYLYGDLLDQAKIFIENSVGTGGWSSFFHWLLVGILVIAFYFLLSWTFVLVIAGIASPFNDVISNRVERVLLGKDPEEAKDSFARIFNRLGKTLLNELKKIIFIIFLNLMAFALSFIGVLAPISMMISSLLLAVGFLDYSWCRKDFTFSECLNDIRTSFFSYGIMGGVFLILITVPILNLFILPYGVVYFSVLHVRKYSPQAQEVINA